MSNPYIDMEDFAADMKSTLETASERVRVKTSKPKYDPNKYTPKQQQPGMGGKTYFLKQGNLYKATSEAAMDMHDHLPAGNYVVKFHMETGFYMERVESFKIPEVIYGDTRKTADRILSTYTYRNQSTGVLLCGQMGSGKTLLAKMISHIAAETGMPTLIINTPFTGDAFNTFISTITQDCIVFFDEFEKVYDEDAQQGLLTLFDGVFGNKKLFVTTCNNKYKIDSHMKNRPGRFYYFLEFSGLEYDFIREYCEKNLHKDKYTEQICITSTLFEDFNFDMLQALVEEVNRYDESPRDAIKFLNTKPSLTAYGAYEVTLFVNGKEYSGADIHQNKIGWTGNALAGAVSIHYKKLPKDEDWEQLYFYPNEVVAMDVREGIIEYKRNEYKLVLKKKVARDFDYEKQLAF